MNTDETGEGDKPRMKANLHESKAIRVNPCSFVVYLCSSVFICGSVSGMSAVQRGRSAALDSADVVKMTDDMAMQIVASESVQNAIIRDGQLKVVVEPVENRMRAEVLPRGQAEAFTARVRVLRARHAPDRFTWIMNRDAYYRLRERELDIDLGPAPEAINPEYALTSRFSSLADEHRKGRNSYYLCVFELT